MEYMSKEYILTFYPKMSEEAAEKAANDFRYYVKFMCNPDNERNCNECPENTGCRNSLPCGQQNCWVCAHCAQLEEDELEDELEDLE